VIRVPASAVITLLLIKFRTRKVRPATSAMIVPWLFMKVLLRPISPPPWIVIPGAIVKMVDDVFA